VINNSKEKFQLQRRDENVKSGARIDHMNQNIDRNIPDHNEIIAGIQTMTKMAPGATQPIQMFDSSIAIFQTAMMSLLDTMLELTMTPITMTTITIVHSSQRFSVLFL